MLPPAWMAQITDAPFELTKYSERIQNTLVKKYLYALDLYVTFIIVNILNSWKANKKFLT